MEISLKSKSFRITLTMNYKIVEWPKLWFLQIFESEYSMGHKSNFQIFLHNILIILFTRKI